MAKRLEIRDNKGKTLESELGDQTKAIERVKELATEQPNKVFELVEVVSVYDTANPPTEIEF